MEEDNTQYFNDEWNNSMLDNHKMRKWQKIYDITIIKLQDLLQEHLIKNHLNGITTSPKDYKTNKDANKLTR